MGVLDMGGKVWRRGLRGEGRKIAHHARVKDVAAVLNYHFAIAPPNRREPGLA